MKNKNFVISLVVYPLDVMVSFGQTDLQLKNSFKNNQSFSHEDYFKKELKKGKCSMLPNGQTIIRMREYPVSDIDFGSLQHEIGHCVIGVLEFIGMTLTRSSEEAYTYLIGYLTTEIYKRIH